MSFCLGIDLGTSPVKLLLIGADQAIIGSSSAPLDVQRPHPGWSEQDPASWLTATEAAMAERRKPDSRCRLSRTDSSRRTARWRCRRR